MKITSSVRPLFALAAALAFAAPVALRAQQPSPSPSPSAAGADPDIFDVIKKGVDKVQKQTKDAKDLAPKLRLLEERQNALLKRVDEMETRGREVLKRQAQEIARLQQQVEKLEAAARAPHSLPPVPPAPPHLPVPPPPPQGAVPPPPPQGVVPPPPAAEVPKPAPSLPMTEPPVKPTPAATP